jgi:hypothetical protein
LQLSEDVAEDTEKPLATCRVGRNRENTPGEADEGWWFSPSETEVTVKRYRIRALGLSDNQSAQTNRHF